MREGLLLGREGVGGGCKSKHYLLMELLLDHKFIFIGFFFTDFLNVLHFCRHAKVKLPRKHWTSISIENIAFKILYY